MVEFVAYIRVSTSKQHLSGLGLAAQQEACERYASQTGQPILALFTEVESGKVNDRQELAAALALCRQRRASLLVAKLDRLARSVSFVSAVMDSDVPIVAADNPHASRLVLHMLAAVAEFEREQISARTKAALAAAKARGTKLGVNGARLAAKEKASATAFALTLAPHIAAARSGGAITLQSMADHLNAAGVPTREGSTWRPSAISRVVKRLEQSVSPSQLAGVDAC